MTPEKNLCITSAVAVGGREGLAKGRDSAFEVKLSTQPVSQSGGDDGTNPARLFVGYADYFRQKWQKT